MARHQPQARTRSRHRTGPGEAPALVASSTPALGSGAQLWLYSLEDSVSGAIAVADGVVVLGVVGALLDTWFRHASAALVTGYINNEAEGDAMLPETRDDCIAMLGALVLERAVYDVGTPPSTSPKACDC